MGVATPCHAGPWQNNGLAPFFKAKKYPLLFNQCFLRETLNKSTFCGEPAQLCDAGPGKSRA